MFSRRQEGFFEEGRTFMYIVEHLKKIFKVGHFSFLCLSFGNMLFFCLSATRKWKMMEVFMTVVMYRSQQHGRRCQRIDTRKTESGIVFSRWGNKASFFSLGRKFDGFHSLSLLNRGAQFKV